VDNCLPQRFAAHATKTPHKVERFLLGGAAHRHPRGGLPRLIRAGKQKTSWTKPLPMPLGLWALNAAGPFADAPSQHSDQRVGGTDRGGLVFGP
jgi:hypothetical protein